MELIKRLGSFIAGGLLGAGVGAAVAMVMAPQSGDEFVEGVERRVDQAKRAGLEAQARTEEELIRRFRAETGDPDALRDQETLTRVETAQAIADLGLAPGAGQARATAAPEGSRGAPYAQERGTCRLPAHCPRFRYLNLARTLDREETLGT